MKSNRLPLLASFFMLAAFLCSASTAAAQSARTWVSGLGDDANPDSRQANGKTFMGTLCKTSAGGEINAIDGGPYGSVTIPKSVTIDGQGVMAGITASGTNGVTVNAGQNDVITLRHLSINASVAPGGSGSAGGNYGILVMAAGVVRIEDCDILGGAINGIDFSPTTTNTTLYILNSRIYDFAGAGININPTGTGCKVIVENTVIEHCGKGINTTASVTISGTTVAGNTGAGLATSGGGTIVTFHDNKIFGNNPDGNATGSLPLR